MGKLATDAAITTPLTEGHLSASILPPPSFVECENALSQSIFFSPASAVADAPCASPCVASAYTEVDLSASNGYSAPDSHVMHGDLHMPFPSASPHAGNYVSSPGQISSMEIGSFTLVPRDMHALPLPCPPHDAVSSTISSRSLNYGDFYNVQISTASSSASHCMVSVTENNFADACLRASFLEARNASSNGAFARRAFLCSYMEALLPALRRIQSQSVCTSLVDKVSSVKLAADMSLAVSAGSDTAWSKALLEKIASSSACRPSQRGRRKTTRTLKKKICSSYALCKRSRCSSIAHTLVNQCGGSFSDVIPFCTVDVVSHDDDGFISSRHGSLSMESLPARRQIRKSKKHACWKGESSYRRILRSMRCKRKLGIVNATSSQAAKANRGASMAISKGQIESLGELVPGGCNMDVPLLLEEAADYILTLKMQVEALQSLCHVLSA